MESRHRSSCSNTDKNYELTTNDIDERKDYIDYYIIQKDYIMRHGRKSALKESTDVIGKSEGR